MDVTAIRNGDYIKVANVDFLDGVTSFDARVSAAGSSAKIELHLDSQTGTSLGTCDVSGASSWTTKTCTVTGGSGKHDLFLTFTGRSGDLFKFNWWKFTGPRMPDGDAGAGGSGGSAGGGGGTSSGAGGLGSGGRSCVWQNRARPGDTWAEVTCFFCHEGREPPLPVDVETYYERYGPMVLRRCRTLLRNDHLAQDAMQDVFVALLRYQDRLTDEAPAALLLRVATNTCLNRMRALGSRPEDADQERLLRIADTADLQSESRAVARDLLAKLFRADDPLAASSQTIAVMHLVDGMTLEEVAREAGMSVSGVRKRLRSVRARLEQLEGAAT